MISMTFFESVVDAKFLVIFLQRLEAFLVLSEVS
jgi:hypothetical protein